MKYALCDCCAPSSPPMGRSGMKVVPLLTLSDPPTAALKWSIPKQNF